MVDIGKNLKDLFVTLLGLMVGCYFVYLDHPEAGALIIGSAFTYGIKNGVTNNKKKQS